MRFTDNPLEGLMCQKPDAGKKEPAPRAELPPYCKDCTLRNSLCDFGICWNLLREPAAQAT